MPTETQSPTYEDLAREGRRLTEDIRIAERRCEWRRLDKLLLEKTRLLRRMKKIGLERT